MEEMNEVRSLHCPVCGRHGVKREYFGKPKMGYHFYHCRVCCGPTGYYSTDILGEERLRLVPQRYRISAWIREQILETKRKGKDYVAFTNVDDGSIPGINSIMAIEDPDSKKKLIQNLNRMVECYDKLPEIHFDLDYPLAWFKDPTEFRKLLYELENEALIKFNFLDSKKAIISIVNFRRERFSLDWY